MGGFDGPGLCALVGACRSDTHGSAARLAQKIWGVRVFDAERSSAWHELMSESPRELSASDLGLPILVVSQFTLYGRLDKGRRPTWEDAAPPSDAEPLVDHVVERLRFLGADVSTGTFGADMRVSLANDGPYTLLLEV